MAPPRRTDLWHGTAAVVTAGLILGSSYSVAAFGQRGDGTEQPLYDDAFRVHRVAGIVDLGECRNDFGDAYQRCDVGASESAGDIGQHFPRCIAFAEDIIKWGKGSVIVHCADGRDRSATVVLAYLMYADGMALRDAIALVEKARPQIAPSRGNMAVLRRYEIWLATRGHFVDPASPYSDKEARAFYEARET